MGYYKQQMIDAKHPNEVVGEPLNREQIEYELAEYDIEYLTVREIRAYALEYLKGQYSSYTMSALVDRYEDLFYNTHQKVVSNAM